MSSFTEDQIKKIVHLELKRIIDTGLMFTEEADTQAKPQTPQAQPKPQPKTDLPFNPELCNWQKTASLKGEYEACKEGPNFVLLKKYLDEHEGKATINGQFYWLFTNKDQIGRKPQKNGVA